MKGLLGRRKPLMRPEQPAVGHAYIADLDTALLADRLKCSVNNFFSYV